MRPLLNLLRSSHLNPFLNSLLSKDLFGKFNKIKLNFLEKSNLLICPANIFLKVSPDFSLNLTCGPVGM